jgi:hypothetical protein
MKHPSSWPYILRMPACMFLVCLVWWGPLILALMAVKHWGRPPEIPKDEFNVLAVLFFFGCSAFILRTLCHRVIEPYFNVQSLQNRNSHLFRPEPLYFTSLRQWARWMFVSAEEDPTPAGMVTPPRKSGRRSQRPSRRRK